MRYYRPSEWLIDYESSAKVTEKQLLRRGAHSHTCQHSDADDEDPNEGPTSSYTDNPMDRFACKGPKTLTVETNDANYSKKKINGHWLQSEENGAAAATAGQANGADKGNIFATLPTGLPHGGNLLISNSLNLKIEIETSSLLPTVPHSQGALNGGLSAGKHSMSGGIHLSSDRKGYATVHLTNGKKMDGNAFEGTLPPNGNQFANDIYSELTFDRHTHKLSRVLSPGAVASGYGCDPSYSADLNYSNSIVALKEQIARAKANFFNAPLSSTR